MKTSPRLVGHSKWVSWALRHDPIAAGITLDGSGWTRVDSLLAAAVHAGQILTRAELEEIVATNDKRRFSISVDGLSIRANQGHSVAVDLGLLPQRPPVVLYHGTAERFVAAILAEGLKRGARQHVHLSADLDTASTVGVRHGRLVLFTVDSLRMHADGLLFYRSENGVWLADAVPPKFLSRLAP